jgi:hypothetical protein
MNDLAKNFIFSWLTHPFTKILQKFIQSTVKKIETMRSNTVVGIKKLFDLAYVYKVHKYQDCLLY